METGAHFKRNTLPRAQRRSDQVPAVKQFSRTRSNTVSVTKTAHKSDSIGYSSADEEQQMMYRHRTNKLHRIRSREEYTQNRGADQHVFSQVDLSRSYDSLTLTPTLSLVNLDNTKRTILPAVSGVIDKAESQIQNTGESVVYVGD